jgi:hypothetical protein
MRDVSTLSPRGRAGPGGHLRKASDPDRQLARALALSATEDSDLKRAIAASLAEQTPPPASTPVFVTAPGASPGSPPPTVLRSEAVALDEDTINATEADAGPSAPRIPSSLDLLAHLPSSFAGQPVTSLPTARRPAVRASPPLAPGDVIGRKLFAYNEGELMTWLRGRLEYWRANREPVGVSEDQTWKCRCVRPGPRFSPPTGDIRPQVLRVRRRVRVARRKGRGGVAAVSCKADALDGRGRALIATRDIMTVLDTRAKGFTGLGGG